MNKNKKMLKCFLEILKSNQKYINYVIPNMYINNFYEIDFSYLKQINIKYLLIDIDGTILPVDDINVSNELINKFKSLESDFKICLLSNNNIERVKPVADKLNISYLALSNKPDKIAFDKALKILDTSELNKIAMIGDQMLSDIYGSKEYGIYSILVNPISNKNNIQTKTQRILQNIVEKQLKKKNLFDKNKYYKTPI